MAALDNALRRLLGMAHRELLWKNASPFSTFPAQTVSLDLTQYKAVRVVMRMWITTTAYTDISQTADVGTESEVFNVLNMHTEGAQKYFIGRIFEAKPHGVVFQNGKSVPVGSAAGDVNNQYNTPYKIYGMK